MCTLTCSVPTQNVDFHFRLTSHICYNLVLTIDQHHHMCDAHVLCSPTSPNCDLRFFLTAKWLSVSVFDGRL